MPDRDTDLALPGDIATALALLTRLPIPARHDRGAAAAWAYPLAGLVVGAIAALVATLAGGLPSALTAGLALLAMIVTTGALHEDGLADTADGLWGGWTRETRLDIMKDSRIGTYGVLALVMSLGLRWTALTTIADAGGLGIALIGGAALSRAPIVALMHALPHARSDGLSSTVGRPGRPATLLALALAAIIGFAAFGMGMIGVAILLTLSTLLILLIARAKIGGQTGDILGATQQVSEIAILACLAA